MSRLGVELSISQVHGFFDFGTVSNRLSAIQPMLAISSEPLAFTQRICKGNDERGGSQSQFTGAKPCCVALRMLIAEICGSGTKNLCDSKSEATDQV
jgi:hypothetical protein